MLCGISTSFEMLFPARGQITHVYSPVCRFTRGLLPFLARLACVRHAASVRSEPGSNSPVKPQGPKALFFRKVLIGFRESQTSFEELAYAGHARTIQFSKSTLRQT